MLWILAHATDGAVITQRHWQTQNGGRRRSQMLDTGDVQMQCVECHGDFPEARMVRLTERSAMCRRCHNEAYAAWQADFARCGDYLRCPAPAELRRRIESLRDGVGNDPKPDVHEVGIAIRGTVLYESKRVAYRNARQVRTSESMRSS